VSIARIDTRTQAKLRHHQSFDRFGFVFKNGAKQVRARVPMHQPMGQFVHQSQEFLLRALAGAHQNQVAEYSARDALGQGRAHQAGAIALGVEFQRANVMEDRGQRRILFSHSIADHHAPRVCARR
jgi:hypothetical protein